MLRAITRWGFVWLLFLPLGCTAEPGPSAESGTPGGISSSDPPSAEPAAEGALTTAAEIWWSHLHRLCGEAYPGTVVSRDEVDAEIAEQSLVMHVRHCEEDRLEVPFHVGGDRSRTWVLTREVTGLQLQHDHRHEDGTADPVTLYGGRTLGPGTETRQDFPADDTSKELFLAQGLEASVANVWTLEVIPGERLSYILRRSGPDIAERHFQADFDLTSPLEPPPAPWGHE